MNVARCVPSIATSRRQTRASAPRAMTMSLSATCRSPVAGVAAAAGSGPRSPSARRSCTRPSTMRSQHRLEVAGLGLREEPDLAEVDAEQRDVDLGDRAGGAQERAVAAEDDERVGRRQLAEQRVVVAGLGLPLVDAAHRGTSRRRARASSTAASLVGL